MNFFELFDMKKKSLDMYFSSFLTLIVIIATFGLYGCTAFVPITAVTAGMVALDERSTGTVIDDAVIISKIKKEFTSNNDINHILTKVSVNSYEGRVLLSGTVKEEKYKEEATKAAWSVHGVKEVINVLEVDNDYNINKANDSWIKSQINAKFLTEKKFNSLNYKVDVNSEVVYMIGIAQDQDELERAISIASKVKGVKKVVNYVLLKKDRRHDATL